jgi:protein-L-isoaspartate(D-aspartate) O-methyltransferase
MGRDNPSWRAMRFDDHRLFLLLVLASTIACPAPLPAENAWISERLAMVKEQIVSRGIKDPRVLAALRKVPRHFFVPPSVRVLSYADRPLPIGENQTISQPYIVAFMTEAAALPKAGKVLEIGTGSGYQAAILAQIARAVYTIEILPRLGARADQAMKDLGYRNVFVKIGDGYKGWPEKAPFDAILLTAAPERVPQPLLDQLKVGGFLVAPIGIHEDQVLVRYEKMPKGLRKKELLPVRFVLMTGKAQEESCKDKGKDKSTVDRKDARTK